MVEGGVMGGFSGKEGVEWSGVEWSGDWDD